MGWESNLDHSKVDADTERTEPGQVFRDRILYSTLQVLSLLRNNTWVKELNPV